MRQIMRTPLVVLCVIPALVGAQRVEWPVYGGDAGASKYSTLAQIDRNNVAQLAVAWRWRTGEAPIRTSDSTVAARPGNSQATPLMIGDTLFFSTPYNRVVAMDATTGRAFWTYDPAAYKSGQPSNGTGFVHRGVATWTDGTQRRVFMNSRWNLIALDAATGQPIRSFGDTGVVDLTAQLRRAVRKTHYTNTSPPVVYQDLVIVGNGVGDRLRYQNDPPGDVQAFDVRTGKRVWSCHTIPDSSEFGVNTWKDGSWRTTGHITHHGLWDYDPPAPPVLDTIHVAGKRIDAVAVPTKMGYLFVFDRVSGKPVWPIVERAVPRSDVTGEATSRTQPVPTLPAPFAVQGFSEDDAADFTPEIKQRAVEVLRRYRFGALYTPPSMQGTIVMPGAIGGSGWGGGTFDPSSGIIYIKATNSPVMYRIFKNNAPSDTIDVPYTADLPGSSVSESVETSSARAPARGTTIPLNKPPYGTLVAINLNTGTQLWNIPFGDTPEIRKIPMPKGVALPPLLGVAGAPGPIVTNGGLLFVSGGGSVLHAIDKMSGKTLWSFDLDKEAYSVPMTYRTARGTRYVVVATGAGGEAELVAFALPGK